MVEENYTHRITYTHPLRYEQTLSKALRKVTGDYLGGSRKRILDAGCSSGLETTRLALENPRHYFIGVDINSRVIENAKRQEWALNEFEGSEGTLWKRQDLEQYFSIKNGLISPKVKPDNLVFLNQDACDLKTRLKFDTIFALNWTLGEFNARTKLIPLLRKGGILVTETKEYQNSSTIN